MSTKMLQVNFKLTVTPAEYEKIAAAFTQPFAELAGLDWKVWLLNTETGEAGGFYAFDDDAALQAFLSGPIPQQLQSAPFLKDLSVKIFDVMPGPTQATRGPVQATQASA